MSFRNNFYQINGPRDNIVLITYLKYNSITMDSTPEHEQINFEEFEWFKIDR